MYANFHVYRGNVSPLRGKKPIFGPVSKNNTGMAALRAGLPVLLTVASNAGVYIWSIIAGWSRVITIWTTVLAYHMRTDDDDDDPV